jgi:WD40 repeat protein
MHCSVQFDGRRVVSGAYDYLVRVWDPVEGKCLHVLQGHTNRVYSLQVNSCVNPLCVYWELARAMSSNRHYALAHRGRV